MCSYFLCLLIKPTHTIKRILQEKPSFKKIIFFLFFIGFLRGFFEIALGLSKIGHLYPILSSFPLLKTCLMKKAPFLLSSICYGYLRWVAFSFIVFLFGRFLGKRSQFKELLRCYGIILGIYLITILPNFAYLFLKLPLIEFRISDLYNPTFGLGQLLTSFWLVFATYKVTRIMDSLPKLEALFIGLSIPLINVGILVFGASLFLRLSSLLSLTPRTTLNLTNYLLVIFPLLAIPLLLWLGYRMDRRP